MSNRLFDVGELAIWEAPILEELDLGMNSIEGELPKIKFVHLKKLSLDGNRISNIDSFCKSSLNSLETLHLNNNQIAGALPILRMKHLKLLDL